jgi:DNA-directed RNA polymerase specialized sigma24 family protein
MVRPMTSLPNHRYLLTRLQREWNLLSRRRSALTRASAWSLTPRAIDSLDELLVLTGLGPGPVDPASDETLRRLVGLARHDDLAARVVLQRMLPGLSNCAKRNSSGFDNQLDALDELLSEAWTVIRSFPIERRDRYVIKNLLRDCEYRAFLKARRRKLVQEVTDPAHLDRAVETDGSPGESTGESLITIVELLGRARSAGMSKDDVDVVVALLNNSTVKQAATALGVTDRTVRNRRQDVVRQLRELADVA